MKILQINNLYDGAGAENVIKDIACGLSEKKDIDFYYVTHEAIKRKNHYQVKSLAAKIFSKFKKGENGSIKGAASISKKISVALRKFYPINNLIIYFRLRRLIKNIKPDIIHCHNIISFSMAPYLLAKKFKIPIVTTLHGYWPICPNSNLLRFDNCEICLENSWKNCKKYCSQLPFSPEKYMKTLKKILEGSNKIVCVSNFVRERLVDFGYSKNKLLVINNGVNVDKFTKNQKTRYNKVVHIGRISELKGSKIVLNVAKKLYSRDKKLKFYFIGSPKPLGIRIPKNCNFRPWLIKQALISEYSSSLTCLSPSIWAEPHSLVNLEAMSCGCPPIVTKLGGNIDSIKNNETGFLLEKNKGIEENIIRKILYLKNNKQVREKMGKQARERARKNFSLKKMLSKYYKLYEGLVN